MTKKLLLFSLTFCAFFYAGCKKDQPVTNHTDEIKKQLIKGQWFYQTLRVTYFDNTGPRLYQDAQPEDIYQADPLTFYDQGTVNFRGDNYNFTIRSTDGLDSLFIATPNPIKAKILGISDLALSLNLQYDARIPFNYAGTNNLAFYTTYVVEVANFFHNRIDKPIK